MGKIGKATFKVVILVIEIADKSQICVFFQQHMLTTTFFRQPIIFITHLYSLPITPKLSLRRPVIPKKNLYCPEKIDWFHWGFNKK